MCEVYDATFPFMKIDVKSYPTLIFSHDVLPPINNLDGTVEKGVS